MQKKRISQNTAIVIGAIVGVGLALLVMAGILLYYQKKPPAPPSSQGVQGYARAVLVQRGSAL